MRELHGLIGGIPLTGCAGESRASPSISGKVLFGNCYVCCVVIRFAVMDKRSATSFASEAWTALQREHEGLEGGNDGCTVRVGPPERGA